ncbi:MAG: hypothetical protein ABL886_06885, partial [Rhodoglobus sp.]
MRQQWRAWHRRLASAAWIGILLIIAGVQFFRGANLDGAIFATIALALLVDATGILPRSERAWRA